MTGPRLGQQQTSSVLQDLTTKVQGLTSPGPGFSDPVSKFTLKQGPDMGHVIIAFRTAPLPGVASVQVWRNLTRDFGTAKQLTQFTAAETQQPADATYADIDTSIVGKKVFYWLRIIAANPNNAPILHGPQSIVAP
jgi:hypothetical protein